MFSDTDGEGDNEDVEMADAESFIPDSASRAPSSDNARRQTVHVPHDSLFSSMEISGSGSASTITGIPTRASGEDTTAGRNMGNGLPDCTALTSTMSLTEILDPTDINKLPTLKRAFEPAHDNTGGFAGDESLSNIFTKDRPKDGSTRKTSSTTCLDDLESLGAKVSEMNLEGLCLALRVLLWKSTNMAIVPSRSRSMPSVGENNRVHQGRKPTAGPSKNGISRKRSDTIRASDYNADRLPQPKVIWLKPAPAPKRKVATRKRSGTVTQRDYQASVRVCKDGRITRIDDGLPLSPQKDDESDDELLLK